MPTLSDEEIVKIVEEVFVESFEVDPKDMKPDSQIFVDLGLDSLDAVDLVVALQDKFAVKIRDEGAVRSIRTLDDLYKLIRKVRDARDA